MAGLDCHPMTRNPTAYRNKKILNTDRKCER